MAFSRDGRTLASGNTNGTIGLWDVADPVHPRPLRQPLITGSSSAVLSVAFSPDRRTLADVNYNGTIRLWNVANPAHPRPLGQPLTAGSGNGVYSVAFSPDGRTLASGNTDGTIGLWNVTDPAHPEPLQPLGPPPLTAGSGNLVYSLAFSPNGRTLASGNLDGTIGLWDVTNPAHPRPLGQPQSSGSSAVDAVAFSPDGRTLASGSNDGTARLWNLNLPYAIERICATAGGLTRQQWRDYIPHLPYRPLCVR